MYEHTIDPLVEFDPCPLEKSESIKLIREIDQYLDEQARPLVTVAKKYGWMILESIAKSGSTLGIRPPRS